MRRTVGEVIEQVKKTNQFQQKVEILQKNDASSLRQILQYAYDDRIKWVLPKGKPPYKENKVPISCGDTRLSTQARRLYIFVEEGNQPRKEMLFVRLLEALDKQEAALLCEVKDRDIKGLSKKVALAAFPDLLGEDRDQNTQA